MYKTIILFILIFILSPITSFSQETITITTYYPSPYGSYRELSAERLKVGRNYAAANIQDDNLVVEGNIGVGVISPRSPAPNNQVQGNIDANDVFLRSINRWVSQVTLPTMGVANPITLEWGPSGWTSTNTNIGSGRSCFSYVYNYVHDLGGSGGRYNDMGCRYNFSSGMIEGNVGGGTLTCGWVCFN